eukprot:CAMPEP_0201490180 /NCGR_PEP_ID=MMETSP0151_2-20130828/25407_1 /ASSEMBLY_ACC=CAM_ASM_000257 /TAXON_ID=200890 /ORGANISM="Paramoeba atlantica, Strain 621/1 / CCAP 1560/9" /LENGTH=1239 /DNA_ID=CAMNT_0047876033 /DNA_START=17 /DNA_END=3736 /DNA_ORIENTATION=-
MALRETRLLLFFLSVLALNAQLLPQYSVVGLNPYTTLPTGAVEFVGRSRSLGYFAAITDINTDPDFPFIFEPQTIDTQRDPDVTYDATVNLIDETIGFVGPHRSVVSISQHDRLGLPSQTPIISAASTSVTLKSKDTYPFFSRVFPSNEVSARAIDALLRQNSPVGTTCSLLVRSDDIASQTFAASLIAFSEIDDHYSYSQQITHSIDIPDPEIIALVDQLAASGNNIFVMINFNTPITAKIYKYSYQKGIAGVHGFQWICDEFSAVDSGYLVDGVRDEEAVLGWEGACTFSSTTGEGPVYDKFLVGYERERQKQEDIDTFFEIPDPKAAYHYDATWLYAYAVQAMLEQGLDPQNGTALMENLRLASFEGATGIVEILPGENDRGGVSVQNLVVSILGKHVIRGSYTDELDIDFIWMGQATYNFGGLLSEDDDPGRSRWLSLQACVSDYNSANWAVVGTILLNLTNENTADDPATAVSAATNLINQPPQKVGMGGTETPPVTSAVLDSVSTPNQMPTISGATTLKDFSDSTAYPYFLRTIPSSQYIPRAITALLDNNAEDSTVIVITRIDNPESVSLRDQLVELSNGKEWVIVKLISVEESQTDFTEILETILAEETFIVVGFLADTSMAAQLMSQANQAEMSGNGEGYQWIFDDVVLSIDSYRIDGVVNPDAVAGWMSAVGFVATAAPGALNDQFRKGYARERDAQANPSSFLDFPDVKAAFHYDMCLVFGAAVNVILQNDGDVFDGDVMMNTLRNIEVAGATGTIAFDENDRAGNFLFRFLQGDGLGSFKQVGSYDGVELSETGFLWEPANTKTFALGFLVTETNADGSNDDEGRAAALSVLAAINDHNNDILNQRSSVNFLLHSADIKGNSTLAKTFAAEFLDAGAVGLVGIISSTLTEEVHSSVLAPHQKPLLSGGAVSAKLSIRTSFPYFLRVYPAGTYISAAITTLLNTYTKKGESISLIYRPAEDASVVLRNFISAAEPLSSWKITQEIPVSSETNSSEIVDQLRIVKVRVIVCIVYDPRLLRQILADAADSGLAGTGSGRQWIVDESAFVPSAFLKDNGAPDLQAQDGWTTTSGFIAAERDGELYEQFLKSYERERIEKENPDSYPSTPTPKASYHYDTITVYLSALTSLIESSGDPFDGDQLIAAMRSVSLTQAETATGQLSFIGNNRNQSMPLVFTGGAADGGFQNQGNFTTTGGLEENGLFHWKGVSSAGRLVVSFGALFICVFISAF